MSKASIANVALQGALNANPTVLPSTTGGARGDQEHDQPPLQTIRDVMIQTLGIKK